MLGEAFYFHRRNAELNIYDSCVSISDPNLSHRRLFQMHDKSIVWPVSSNGSILMQSVSLSNIEPDAEISSVYCVGSPNSGCFFYVGGKSAEWTESPRGQCHIFVYNLSNSNELNYLQDLKLLYKPLDIRHFRYDRENYILVLGSDKDIHVYGIDMHSGELFRSSPAESVKATWKSVLGFGESLCLRVLVENWGHGQQGVAGFADGYLYWHRRSQLEEEEEEHSSNIRRLDSRDHEVQAKPNRFWAAVLLDSAVTCMSFYAQKMSFDRRRCQFLQKLGLGPCGVASDVLIAGLANGSVLLLSCTAEMEGSECYVLTGLEESTHGAVTAICTGDISGKGTDNIVIGHHDGTVIVYSVHSEFFSEVGADEIPPPYERNRSNTSVYDTSDDPANNYRFNSDADMQALVEEFRVTLPFPVVGMEYGSFLGEVETVHFEEVAAPSRKGLKKNVSFAVNDPTDGDESRKPDKIGSTSEEYVIYGEQLAVLTSHGLHLFTNRRRDEKDNKSTGDEKSLLIKELVGELKKIDI